MRSGSFLRPLAGYAVLAALSVCHFPVSVMERDRETEREEIRQASRGLPGSTSALHLHRKIEAAELRQSAHTQRRFIRTQTHTHSYRHTHTLTVAHSGG